MQQVLDEAALLPARLMTGKWIASYYVAPLGEVLLRDAAARAGEAAFSRHRWGREESAV